ncbi:hypothetical protein EJ06DRAFT_1731 [Trichodelitschia bisporula]|uniref:Uncharacterized protein n=1 Tax=Trichodelitschia bisporula TaxID=703511 RepID=A0A6G1I9B5_9PEZI|nr:hypothetical protein EJ06DRAFT_1731 [Trichodelitschia bisporula]
MLRPRLQHFNTFSKISRTPWGDLTGGRSIAKTQPCVPKPDNTLDNYSTRPEAKYPTPTRAGTTALCHSPPHPIVPLFPQKPKLHLTNIETLGRKRARPQRDAVAVELPG